MEQIHSDWQRREELIDELLDMNAEERFAFIDSIAAESPRDADALRKWLKGIEQPLDYLNPASPALSIQQGDMVGNWRVLSPIGRGGMGEVWLGERADGLFEKRVAIKFIRSDRLGLSSSIESERRLLAGLQHPGIVRLLDAGVSGEGHAFLVTDFIEGTTLDVWLEQQQPPLSQRLDLLRQVAEALAYAHERLVIHRDIKPRNILVDSAGRAYLLDFGIARALADLSDAPQTTNLILTPEFAAPELIVENVASVRSDIYALGGLLYFLLCLRAPLSVRGLPLLSAIKVIRDESPSHTGDIAQSLFPTEPKRLLSDLDAIALKALAKSPRERYGTIEAFLADVEAARGNRPIQAKLPDAWDRMRRYLRRHKVALVVATIVAVSLLAGMAGTLWQAHQARLQSARAEDEATHAKAAAKNANAVRDFLVEVFSSVNPSNSLGKMPTAAELLDNGVRRAEAELGDQPELQAQLLDTMGVAYGSLTQPEKAADIFRRARSVAIAAQGEDSPLATKITLDFANAIVDMSHNGDDYKDLLRWVDAIIKHGNGLENPVQQVSARVVYANLLRTQGDMEKSDAVVREAIALGRAVAPKADAELAAGLQELREILARKGHTLEAIEAEKEVLAMRSRLSPAFSPAVAQAQLSLAVLLNETGKLDDAADLMAKALDAMRALYGETNTRYAAALSQLAIVRERQGRLDDAEALLLQDLAILKKTGQENTLAAMAAYNLLAVVKAHQKDEDQAIQYVQAALAISTKAYGRTALPVIMQQQNLSILEGIKGDYPKAELGLRETLALLKETGSDNTVPALQWLGVIRRLRGDPAEARALHSEALAKAKALQGDGSIVVFKLYSDLALDERDLQHFDQAKAHAEVARDGLLKQQHDPNSPDVQGIRYVLAEFEVLQNRCTANVGDLEATWKHRKELKDSLTNRWQAAEAGMFFGLCRKRTSRSDSAENRELLATSVRTLHSSPLADPFIKRFAATVQIAK